jgi:hypothetical protein
LLLRRSHSACDESGDLTLERGEDCERETDVEADAHQSWHDSHVEPHESLSLIDLGKAVTEAIELVGVNALHLSLHDVDWVVCHGRAETSEDTGGEVNNDLDAAVLVQVVLGIFEDDEADTLVGGLLHESGEDTLVQSTGSLLRGDGVNAVEHVSVLRLFAKLVVNQFRLQGLLWGHDEESFGCASADTAQEVVGLVALG